MILRRRSFRLIIPSLLILPIFHLVQAEVTERLFPLPVAEVEQILSQWLLDSSFEIARRDLEGFRVQLKGMKEREVWEVILRPHSPLACWVQPRLLVRGQPAQERVEALWKVLEAYLKENELERRDPAEEVPARIKSRMEAIVCIKVDNGREEIQFTGFAIDRKGLILSTAHDLRGVREVTILLADGQIERGALIKIDPDRDLTLINIRSRVSASISLTNVRNFLRNGERVYAIGCPGNVRSFLSGTIDGPLRQANHLPLSQVKMDIQPGSSGSPVFDQEGAFVGLVKGRYRGDPSTGFIIPSSTILEFLREK